MASFFNQILASFSPLRGRLRENVSGNDSESDGGGGSVAVAPGAAVGAEEGAAGTFRLDKSQHITQITQHH